MAARQQTERIFFQRHSQDAQPVQLLFPGRFQLKLSETVGGQLKLGLSKKVSFRVKYRISLLAQRFGCNDMAILTLSSNPNIQDLSLISIKELDDAQNGFVLDGRILLEIAAWATDEKYISNKKSQQNYADFVEYPEPTRKLSEENLVHFEVQNRLFSVSKGKVMDYPESRLAKYAKYSKKPTEQIHVLKLRRNARRFAILIQYFNDKPEFDDLGFNGVRGLRNECVHFGLFDIAQKCVKYLADSKMRRLEIIDESCLNGYLWNHSLPVCFRKLTTLDEKTFAEIVNSNDHRRLRIVLVFNRTSEHPAWFYPSSGVIKCNDDLSSRARLPETNVSVGIEGGHI